MLSLIVPIIPLINLPGLVNSISKNFDTGIKIQFGLITLNQMKANSAITNKY